MKTDDIVEKISFEKEEKKEKKPTDIYSFFLMLLIAVAASLFIVKFVAVRSVVDGSSMNDTLSDKDNLIVEKISYYLHDPQRFDVVVFELKDEPGVHYIKRIIGLPGDTVLIKDGKVYINGGELTEDIYGKDLIANGGNAIYPVTLGKDQYFLLGDNRNDSSDSRFNKVGLVSQKQFLGKAVFRFYPLNKIKVIR